MSNRYKSLLVVGALIFAALLLRKKVEFDLPFANASTPKKAWVRFNAIGVAKKSVVGSDSQKETRPTTDAQIAEPENAQLTPDLLDLLCALKSTQSNIPMHGKIQVFATRRSPFFRNTAENVAWVKSDVCPAGTYSILHYMDDGQVIAEVDCRTATLTDLATLSGEQGRIESADANDGESNLAVSGNGYFVLGCPSGKWILTREGKFRQDPDGHLVNDEGCVLLDQRGTAFQNDHVDRSGCNSKQDCLAILDPAFDDVEGLEYVNNYSFQAVDPGPLMDSVTKRGSKALRPKIFENALEDVHNSERGLTSVSWSSHLRINLSDIRCR